MKRFFPLLLGLTLICFSFTLNNETSSETPNDLIVESPIELCAFAPAPNGYNTSQCPGMPAELTIADDCTGTSAANLLVTNLHPNPIIGQVYPLPGGQPPIYYEYEANGTTTVTGPITSLTYKGKTHKVGTISYPVFEYPLPMTFDCFDNCVVGQPYLFFDAKVTYASGELYDVLDYSASDQIFYNGVFEVDPPSWTIQACSQTCGACGTNKMVGQENIELNSAQTFSLENGSSEEEVNSLTYESKKEFGFEISPNPFTNDINIQFSTSIDNPISIEIIDVSGKTIMRNANVSINDQSLSISGESLDSGLYYCRIVSDKEVSTKRLIKN